MIPILCVASVCCTSSVSGFHTHTQGHARVREVACTCEQMHTNANVAADHMSQSGRPQVGHPWSGVRIEQNKYESSSYGPDAHRPYQPFVPPS
jgi:hypothetical protein